MGVFEVVFQALSIDADFEIDSTSCKVHQSATGGEKTGDKAVGVSRGGRNTKIHALVDGLGNPLAFLLSSGNDHDSKHAVPLLSQIEIEGSNILGDKAYGAKAIRNYIDSQNAVYTIPPKSDVNDPWLVDWRTYKERRLIECSFQKLKWFRRVFTHYDKLDSSFLAFVHIAAIFIYGYPFYSARYFLDSAGLSGLAQINELVRGYMRIPVAKQAHSRMAQIVVPQRFAFS